MAKRTDKKFDEPHGFDHVDYLRAAGFAFDFQRGVAVTLVAIKEGVKLEARTFSADQVEGARQWIGRLNQDRYNIYFHVNVVRDGFRDHKAKKTDIAAVWALHVDVDELSDQALDKLANFKPKPTIILCSGGGYQAFWFLKTPTADLDYAEAINLGLAETLGGDKCQNADRIMRVPETINWPNSKKRKAGRMPAKAYLIEDCSDFERIHDITEFADFEKRESGPALPTPYDGIPDFPDVDVEALGLDDENLIALIKTGDDPKNPRGESKERFRTRSEGVASVMWRLARRSFGAETIAGILTNPAHGISLSILENPRPRKFAFRQAQKAIAKVSNLWPDVTAKGKPIASFANAIAGLHRLSATFEHDAFKNRKRVGGHALNAFQGDLTDDAAAMLRRLFLEKFGFDPGKQHLLDAIQVVCLENSYHPVRDYIDGLRWDGTPRLDSWLTTHLGADNTPLNRAIGKLLLVAAIRRVREPGCKFDTMVVLEGKQGSGKSTAVAILAGEGNFSDQNLIALDDKAQMEALEGVWFFEVAELDGMSRAEVSKVKAFISRTEDRGRPAYARFKESWPRQCVLVGTTNDVTYLKDSTGNRRFLPVKTSKIDLDGLLRDRDQLFAEAAQVEATGFPLVLDKDLWADAATAQQERLQEDPWLDILANARGYVRNRIERIETHVLLGEDYLRLPAAQVQPYHAARLGVVMRELGWTGPKKIRVHEGDDPVRGYERPTSSPEDPDY